MRNFSGGAVVGLTDRGAMRLVVWSPTGERVYHDLTADEADAMRESLASAVPAPMPEPAPAPVIETIKRRSGKEK